MSRDWDAATYDRVSAPQVAWAERVLARLPLRGDETVLDAGCGSGRVTRMLLERLPDGQVVAVDSTPSMVEHARDAHDRARATVLLADLTELVLDEPVDAVFSNAVFHWIPDHEALFARLYDALLPRGRLVAQCGGKGNVARFHAAAWEVAAEEPVRRVPRRVEGPLALRGRRGDGGAARAGRLRGRQDLARAPAGEPAGPDRLPPSGLPWAPPGAAA
jgi:trans-aconitate 2-methyltransferase